MSAALEHLKEAERLLEMAGKQGDDAAWAQALATAALAHIGLAWSIPPKLVIPEDMGENEL